MLVFLEETSAWKNHFEFVWPLWHASNIKPIVNCCFIINFRNKQINYPWDSNICQLFNWISTKLPLEKMSWQNLFISSKEALLNKIKLSDPCKLPTHQENYMTQLLARRLIVISCNFVRRTIHWLLKKKSCYVRDPFQSQPILELNRSCSGVKKFLASLWQL